MYYEKRLITKEDIHSYLVFKKRRFGIRRKTIRRRLRIRPKKGRVIEIPVKSLGLRIINGVFSYVHWCPSEDPEYEVWLCKIPKGTLVYSNSWEHVSSKLELICRCSKN